MRYSMWISVDPLMYDGTFWEGEGNSVGVFDGTIITTPIIIHANDTVSIRVYKTINSLGKFQLIGNR